MNAVSDEKDLLAQIDAFRNRAEVLQSAIDARTEQAKELDLLVNEKQAQALDLENLIKEREAQANVFTKVIHEEMDAVSDEFTTKLNQVDASFKQSVEGQTNVLNDMTASIAEIAERLERVEFTAEQIPEAVHKESVQNYRNTSELIKNLDQHVSKIEEVDRQVKGVKFPIVFGCILSLLSCGGLVYVILTMLGIL